MTIQHISDTARWVAVYRAMETDRPDAIFRDPFARRLAGAKGEAIVDQMKRGRAMAWTMIVRTAVFDELILEAIAGGADTVINLAAGLDARPWRLTLPPELRWIDIDLPDMLQYKTETLGDAKPHCQYEAIPTDLTDEAARRALFAKLGADAKHALIVTEGLLVYLTEEQVGSLAGDLHAQPSFRWWLLDLISPRLLQWIQKDWGKALEQGNAPFRFAPASSSEFFKPFGWRELAFRPMGEEARRLHREMPRAWVWRFMSLFMSNERKNEYRRMSGLVALERV
jgi:methyltransferase (TIGR00027 family)